MSLRYPHMGHYFLVHCTTCACRARRVSQARRDKSGPRLLRVRPRTPRGHALGPRTGCKAGASLRHLRASRSPALRMCAPQTGGRPDTSRTCRTACPAEDAASKHRRSRRARRQCAAGMVDGLHASHRRGLARLRGLASARPAGARAPAHGAPRRRRTGALHTGGDFGITGRSIGRPSERLSSRFRCIACATAARCSAACDASSSSTSGPSLPPLARPPPRASWSACSGLPASAAPSEASASAVAASSARSAARARCRRPRVCVPAPASRPRRIPD